MRRRGVSAMSRQMAFCFCGFFSESLHHRGGIGEKLRRGNNLQTKKISNSLLLAPHRTIRRGIVVVNMVLLMSPSLSMLKGSNSLADMSFCWYGIRAV